MPSGCVIVHDAPAFSGAQEYEGESSVRMIALSK
jgi:hypothetical protein